MIQLGEYNYLQILKEVDFGYFLDDGNQGEILLPKDQTEQAYSIDEWLEVFLYLDSEDRIVATTKKPKAMVNQFAYLEVVQVNSVGAFLDWGLPKDVLVPFHEQKTPMQQNQYYLVYLYLDERSGRITASSRHDRFLNYFNDEAFQPGQVVELIIQSVTDLGFKCIVDDTHWGLLYTSDVFQSLSIGQSIKGYIKQLREDDKLDVCLHKPGYDKIEGISESILRKLKSENGFIPVTDKSSPEMISQLFGISKKAFKKAIGALYKKRLIVLEDEGIRLTKS